MLTDAKWYSSLAIELAVVFVWAMAAAAVVGNMTFSVSSDRDDTMLSVIIAWSEISAAVANTNGSSDADITLTRLWLSGRFR